MKAHGKPMHTMYGNAQMPQLNRDDIPMPPRQLYDQNKLQKITDSIQCQKAYNTCAILM